MDIKIDEVELEINYSDTKNLTFEGESSRGAFKLLDISCPVCNHTLPIRGWFEYSFGIYANCNNCGTEFEFEDSNLDINVYAKFKNLKSLTVVGNHNYDIEDENIEYTDGYNDNE